MSFITKSASKVSNELFSSQYRYKLSLHAQKLLFALASGIKDEDEFFPVWRLRISDIFAYLNLRDDNNSRYDAVRAAFAEIMKNPLEFKESDKKWTIIHWLSYCSYDAENSIFVNIEFNKRIKPLLLQLKEYCLLDMKYYARFSNINSMLLYPRLRSVANMRNAKYIVTINDLIKITSNEDKKSYKGTDKARNCLLHILGIKKSAEGVWLPVPGSALDEINEKSDLYCCADVVKKGRSYDSVVISVYYNESSPNYQKKLMRKINKTYYRDDRGKKAAIEEVRTGTLFAHAVPLENALEIAKDLGVSLPVLLRKHGYRYTQDKKNIVKI
jgi:plasmid replication initiation protein